MTERGLKPDNENRGPEPKGFARPNGRPSLCEAKKTKMVPWPHSNTRYKMLINIARLAAHLQKAPYKAPKPSMLSG
jgi:hypothetical protein